MKDDTGLKKCVRQENNIQTNRTDLYFQKSPIFGRIQEELSSNQRFEHRATLQGSLKNPGTCQPLPPTLIKEKKS